MARFRSAATADSLEIPLRSGLTELDDDGGDLSWPKTAAVPRLQASYLDEDAWYAVQNVWTDIDPS